MLIKEQVNQPAKNEVDDIENGVDDNNPNLKLATTEDSCHSLNERLIPNSSTKRTCLTAYPEVRISKGVTSCASHSRLSS